MGQQQLLLVILVTILVGIATVVAINVFGTQAEEANVDAVRQDILGAAAQAQGYYTRPDMMGGGGNSFGGIEINDLGIAGVTNDSPNNQNGSYELSVEGDALEITGHPASRISGFDPDGGSVQTADQGESLTAEVVVGANNQVDITWTSS